MQPQGASGARMRPIGVFGGTFDPIHYGHLRPALEILQALRLAEVRFIPCGDPPHRARPEAPAEFRYQMVKAAVADQPGFVVDDLELRRKGPSYTTDTLESLKEVHGDVPLCLLLGMDAFLGLSQWHEWRRLFDLAHIVVAHRPGWTYEGDGPLDAEMESRYTDRVADLHAAPAGRIFTQEVTQLEISSTAIRSALARGESARYLMPDSVFKLIQTSHHYREATGT